MQVTRTIGFNGLGEFFVISRFWDGSVGQTGPFARGELAVAEIKKQEKEDEEWADAQAEAEMARGPEFPNGEFPF